MFKNNKSKEYDCEEIWQHNASMNDGNEKDYLTTRHPDETIYLNEMDKIQCKEWLKENLLLLLAIAGVAVGFIIGFSLMGLALSEEVLIWIEMPGIIFLRLLTMMIVPLVISSIISGCSSLDPRLNGKMGLYTFIYVFVNNVIGCLIGFAIVYAIKPGDTGGIRGIESTEVNLMKLTTSDVLADLVRNIFPANAVDAMIRSEQTVLKVLNTSLPSTTTINSTLFITGNSTLYNSTDTEFATKIIRKVRLYDGSNLLGVLFFSTVFGIACSGSMRTPSQPIIHLMTAVMQVILKLFSYFLWFSPIGIASLICNALLRVESDISVTFELLGYFAMTIVVGLVFHQLVYLQVMYVLIVRSNPVVMFINSLKSWITIFATTSSYAVMPEIIRTCEKHGVDRRVYGFVVPFCAGTNRNGSAIFVTAATIFIAQMNGISLNPATTFTIGLLVSLAMFALPGVPSASMVCILMILTSTGLPTNSINMLFALEWILDRLRSTSNVLSTCYCAAIVNKLVTDDIERWDALQLHEGNEQTVVFLKESAV